MKFGIVTHTFPGRSTPFVSPFVKDFAEVLSEFGETSLFFLRPFFTKPDRPDSNGFPLKEVRFLSLPHSEWSSISQSSLRSALSQEMENSEIDHFILEFFHPAGLLAPLVVEKGKLCSLHIHGSDWHNAWAKKSRHPQIKKVLEVVTFILVSGDQLAESIRIAVPSVAEKVRVVYNVVREDLFFPPNDKSAEQNNMSWKSDVSHVLCVGHAHRLKRIDLIFEAYAKSEYLRTKTHLHYVGELNDSTYSKKILSLADGLPVESRTLYPPVSKQELAGFYRAADVYVQPSYREGFGISMIEAAMCGVPVLACQTGIAPYLEMINAAEIMKSDGSDLAEKLETMVIHEKKLNSTVQNHIEVTFGRKASMERIKKIFEVDLLGE